MTTADIIFGTLLALVVPGIVICALGIIAAACEWWEERQHGDNNEH